MMESKEIAHIFSALAHPARVDILKCLLAHSPGGLNFGSLGQALGIPNSTLKHHLNEMEAGQIIQRQIGGRSTRITLSLGKLAEVVTLLNDICCKPQTFEPVTKENT